MRNISPESAQITNDVLDRILVLKRDLDTPKSPSIFTLLYCITTVKKHLALYQPTWAESVALKKGKRSKGGLNSSPSTPRPAPPKGQRKENIMRRAILKVTPLFIGNLFYNGDFHYRTSSGLPDDAKFISSWWDPESNCYNLCYESDSFADVPEGDRMPYIDPPICITIQKEEACP